MASTFYVAPTANFISKTLNGAITDSATTITLNNITSMQAPGYVVIDRTDANGTSTSSAREVVSYTGISGNDLTGCTRPADGSTARTHSDGAIVETMPTIGMWNSLTTIVASGFDSSGYLKAINSPVSIAIGRFTQFDTPSIASIARLESGFIKASSALVSIATILGHLNVSGASVFGLQLVRPVFAFTGSISGPTTLLHTPLPMPRAGLWSYANVITRTVASGASLVVDINKNGTSIFDANTRPTIVGGGTFASTASIATKGFAPGDRISWDVDTGAGVGLHITDFDVVLVSE